MKTTIDADGTFKQYRFPADTTPITIFHSPVDRATMVAQMAKLLSEQDTSFVSLPQASFVLVRDLDRGQLHVQTQVGTISMPLHHAFSIVLDFVERT